MKDLPLLNILDSSFEVEHGRNMGVIIESNGKVLKSLVNYNLSNSNYGIHL